MALFDNTALVTTAASNRSNPVFREHYVRRNFSANRPSYLTPKGKILVGFRTGFTSLTSMFEKVFEWKKSEALNEGNGRLVCKPIL